MTSDGDTIRTVALYAYTLGRLFGAKPSTPDSEYSILQDSRLGSPPQ